MHQKICVIGCGWLGFKLAERLIKNSYEVHGSTTSKTKIPSLKQAHIIPFVVRLSPTGVMGQIDDCLSHCKTLIVNIPPGLRKNPNSDYVKQMTFLLEHIETSMVEHVVFISSTSVYDDHETFPVITENSPTSTSKTALKLVAVERLFQKNTSFKTTILRFSGLFAEDRHPAKFLSGKTNLKNANAPVNLIHRDDCISIIMSIVQHNLWDLVLNASALTHPIKKTYYTAVCNALNIPVPEFNKDVKSKGKIINSQKLVRLLNYEFQVKL
ncbi:NAD-dependent epimerase/dehydratase family protein [uncultured Psychroserpens sp.]|uniref:NAD-dependent epimerase/dehydratase family protein n=1 Tax=uncultured Psychroserpens sp. TaxID=255436 RepID=UPI002639B723|nr:NAD-dependent epimerase/dehydratase family protein [uncultured Psychroserpens sp.]